MTADRALELELPAEPDSVARARHGLEGLRGTLKDPLLEDVRLLVSEIVTNSLRHAELTAADRVSLRVVANPTRVRAEVLDPGPGFVAAPSAPPVGSGSGWGLFLVQRLADRWGVDRRDHRTRVWFELDC